MSAPTWPELVDRFIDQRLTSGLGDVGFTRQDVADWWDAAGMTTGYEPHELRRKATTALATYVDRQGRVPTFGYHPRHVIHSEGYGTSARWRILGVGDAREALRVDVVDAAHRVARDCARHAIAAADPDPAERAIIEGHAGVIGLQLEVMLRQLTVVR
jgi:hypothetical protein